ncbi:MAG TPA: hypothetical protein VGI55_05825 [Solirubrobacteraceae bacterium]
MIEHHRRARVRWVCAQTIAIVALALGTAAGANAATVREGYFAGTTSQHTTTNDITFRFSGATITDRIITWRAQCQTGATLTTSTETPRIHVLHGRWHSGGSYDTPVPPGMTAHITVLADEAHLTSPISAAGVWRAQAVLFESDQQIDTCQTGPVSWAAGTLAAGRPSTQVVPRGEKVAGVGYRQWEARAWQWDDEHIRDFPGVASTPGASRCATAGQHGLVWFLHGDIDQSWFYTRSCTVPPDRYLYLDTPSNECSTVEASPFHATTTAALERCARQHTARSSLALDGKVLSPSGFGLATGVFTFRMPAVNNWLGVPGATSGRAAVYGQGIMLRPLGPGAHTLVRVTQYRNGPVSVTVYHLAVR